VRDEVASFYDAISEGYHFGLGAWRTSVERYGTALEALLGARLGRPGPWEVLDCSCGIGTQAIGIALHGHRVKGTDLSAASLARAQREASSFGVVLETAVVDMRRLADEAGGPFDVVLTGGNSLAHFDREGLGEVFRSARAVLEPGGVFLATVRDYDRVAPERPRFVDGHVHDADDGRRISFQLWDWEPEGHAYTMDWVFLRDRGGDLEVTRERTYLHAHLRAELSEALAAAGFEDVRWHMPDRSGLVEPAVTALGR
jgi:glycine/sarcosine N-methyltransferase